MSIRSSYPSIAPSLSLDFAKSRRLDPRITFTRAQTGNIATYVGADGLVKYAGPDEPRFDHRSTFRTNLLPYSEEFNNWVSVGVTKTANVTSAPNGSLTADRVVEDTSSGQHNVQKGSITKSGIHVVSVYAKLYSGNHKFRIATYKAGQNTGADTVWVYDLQLGVATRGSGPLTGGGMEYAGDGWWRCYATTGDVLEGTGVFFGLFDNISHDYVGDGTSGIYLWGAQLEEGSVLTDYIATGPATVTKTNIESLGLLVEESRTNLSLYSQDFTNNTSTEAWPVSPTTSRAYLISNTGINDPSGGTTASRWASGTTNSEELIYHFLPSLLTIGSTYTASVWIRRVSGTGNVSLIIGDNAGQVVTSQVDSVPYGTWVRCSGTRTITGANGGPGRAYILVYPDDAGNPTTIDIWGYQMEAGAFPTSYIPTQAATITRPTDAISISGANFSDWYNPNEWSIGIEQRVEESTLFSSPNGRNMLRFRNSANLNGFEIRFVSSLSSPYLDAHGTIPPESIVQFDFNGSSGASFPEISKSFLSVKTNDAAFCFNKTVQTDGSVTIFDSDFINLCESPTVSRISKISYYPKRLTNTQLQTLTIL